jgi:HlyD family secretion protein
MASQVAQAATGSAARARTAWDGDAVRRRSIALLCLALGACNQAADESLMSGYVEAELVYLAPSIGGALQSVAVKRGDRVARGDLLYVLDAQAETIGREAAQARSESAKAQERNLRKGSRAIDLQVIDQQLAQAQATLEASESTLQRNRRLVEQGFLAPLRLEELVAARDRDAARVRELRARRVVAAEAARVDEIAAAAAQSRAAQDEVALAGWRAKQKEGEAPADARVFDVMYRPGEWVSAGAPVVALLPDGALKLRFFVPETALPRAKIGSEVRVACDGCPPGLTARIRWVSPQAEYTPPVIYSNSSRSKLVFMVEAQPTDASALKPGQPVDVRFASAPE